MAQGQAWRETRGLRCANSPFQNVSYARLADGWCVSRWQARANRGEPDVNFSAVNVNRANSSPWALGSLMHDAERFYSGQKTHLTCWANSGYRRNSVMQIMQRYARPLRGQNACVRLSAVASTLTPSENYQIVKEQNGAWGR